MSHDAITGHWEGDMTAVGNAAALDLPDTDAYLDHIRTPYQALVLDCTMRGLVRVVGKGGEATMYLGDERVTKVSRPEPGLFVSQLNWLRAYADLRDDRLAEIHMQLDDMLSFFGALAYLDSGRRKYSLMMLDAARSLAIHIETPMKYYCRAPRPIDFAPQIQPMIQTPDHSSYPSGHAMEAFAVATVLYRLMTGNGPEEGIRKTSSTGQSAHPFRLAHRIAANRTVAGVHFPVDSYAGAYVGCCIGDLIWSLASGEELGTGNAKISDEDFLLSTFDAGRHFKRKVSVEKSELVTTLWNRAASEWPGKPAYVSKPRKSKKKSR